MQIIVGNLQLTQNEIKRGTTRMFLSILKESVLISDQNNVMLGLHVVWVTGYV
jgi:hypothetical protein